MPAPLTSLTSNTPRDKLIALLETVLASTSRLSENPADWLATAGAWEHKLTRIPSASTETLEHRLDKVGVFTTNGRPYYNLSQDGMITLMLPFADNVGTGWDGPSLVRYCKSVCTTMLSALRALEVRMDGDRLVFGYDIEPWKVALTLIAETNAERLHPDQLAISLPTPWASPQIMTKSKEAATVDKQSLADFTCRPPSSCEITVKSAGPFHQVYIGVIQTGIDSDMAWVSSPVERLRAIAAAIAAGAIERPKE